MIGVSHIRYLMVKIMIIGEWRWGPYIHLLLVLEICDTGVVEPKEEAELTVVEEGCKSSVPDSDRPFWRHFSKDLQWDKSQECLGCLGEGVQRCRKGKIRKIYQTLRRDFAYARMKDNELLKDYFTRLTEVINQLKSYGEEW